MTIETGGPAFPMPFKHTELDHSCEGMTLRDYFAAKALNALISGAPSGTSLGVSHMITNMNYALASYAIADAMLEARNASPE